MDLTMPVLVIIQARMSSHRLPGKVMFPIQQEPMLWRQYQRIKRAKSISDIIVATSDHDSDLAIVDFCHRKGIKYTTGPLEDVLTRFYKTSLKYPSEHIVRLTADCPLISPEIIDNVIDLHLANHADYSSNCMPYTLPDGLDIEVMRAKVLKDAYLQASTSEHREHVTPYIRARTDIYKIQNYLYPKDYSGKRWTVDYFEDYLFVQNIFNALYPLKNNFDIQDVIDYLSNNAYVERINACRTAVSPA